MFKFISGGGGSIKISTSSGGGGKIKLLADWSNCWGLFWLNVVL